MKTNDQPDPRIRAVLLPLAGLCSSTLTLALGTAPPSLASWTVVRLIGPFLESAAFGAAIGLYFLVFTRAWAGSMLFVLACVAAHWLSVFVGAMAAIALNVAAGLPIESHGPAVLPAFLLAGTVGAMIVLFGALYLFGPGRVDRGALRRAALWSMGGGGLAVFGWRYGQSIETLAPSQYMPLTTIVVWQTGVALVIALMLSLEEHAAAEPPERGDPVSYVFFLAVITVIGFVVVALFYARTARPAIKPEGHSACLHRAPGILTPYRKFSTSRISLDC